MFRPRYNSPVILTYAFLCLGILLCDVSTFGRVGLIENWCVVRGTMAWDNPQDYLRLISHVFGHANWEHFVSNFTLILLVGPSLEEKYGSWSLSKMMLATGLITGILNVLLFDTGLLGGSGIAFMLIIMGSFTNIKRGELPLTFVAVALLFLSVEVKNAFYDDNISQFAHLLGGGAGAIFGFWGQKESSGN